MSVLPSPGMVLVTSMIFGIVELRLDLDGAVDAQEGLHAGRGLGLDRERMLVLIAHAGKVGNDAEQVGADVGLDVPGALDPVIHQVQSEDDAEEDGEADQQARPDDARGIRRVGHEARDGAVEQADGDVVVEPLGRGRLVEAVEHLGIGVLGDGRLVLDAVVFGLEVIQPHLLLLLAEVLAIEGLLGIARFLEARVQVGDGLVDGPGQLLLEQGDVLVELDDLRMPLKVALAEHRLALGGPRELVAEIGNGAVARDVGDLEQVAVSLLEALDLAVVHLEVQPVEVGGGARGIHAFQPVGHDVQAVVERDEVVLLLVFLQALLLVLVFLLQLGRALLEKRDRLLVGAAALGHQVVDELAVETVGDDGGGLGIAMPGGDQDDEAAAHGFGGHVSEDGRGRRRRGAGTGPRQERPLEDLDLRRASATR